MTYFRIGDPHDDFDRHDRDLARKEARLPVCERCLKRISDDFYWDMEGEILCEDCMNIRYRKYTEDFIEL